MSTSSKIAITTSSFGVNNDAVFAPLREIGAEIVLNPHGRKLTEDELIEVASGCVGVIAGTEPVTRRALEALPELKVVSRCGIGMDNVDRAAMKDLGRLLYNTPDAPTDAVAELTVGLMLSLLRNVPQMDRAIREGGWKRPQGSLLSAKRVGIVGFGRIGKRVASLVAPFGVVTAYYDVYRQEDGQVPFKDLASLVAWADILTLHAPRPADGSPILDRALIEAMRPGSWVVNVARGELIDEAALAEALASGLLRGAALDVFQREPYTGPLTQVENTVLTPHVGSNAFEARTTMEAEAVTNLLAGLREAGLLATS